MKLKLEGMPSCKGIQGIRQKRENKTPWSTVCVNTPATRQNFQCKSLGATHCVLDRKSRLLLQARDNGQELAQTIGRGKAVVKGPCVPGRATERERIRAK